MSILTNLFTNRSASINTVVNPVDDAIAAFALAKRNGQIDAQFMNNWKRTFIQLYKETGNEDARIILHGFFGQSNEFITSLRQPVKKESTVIKPIATQPKHFFGVDKEGIKHHDRCVIMHVLQTTIDRANDGLRRNDHEAYGKARAGLIKAIMLFGDEMKRDMKVQLDFVNNNLPVRWVPDGSPVGYHEHPAYTQAIGLSGLSWISSQAGKLQTKFMKEFKGYVPCSPHCDNVWNSNHKMGLGAQRPGSQHEDYPDGYGGKLVINQAYKAIGQEQVAMKTPAFIEESVVTSKPWWEIAREAKAAAPAFVDDRPWYERMASIPKAVEPVVPFTNPKGLDAMTDREIMANLRETIGSDNWLSSLSTWLEIEAGQAIVDVLRARAKKEGWTFFNTVVAFREWQEAAKGEALTA